MKKRTLVVFMIMAILTVLCFAGCSKEPMTLEKYAKDNPDVQESIDKAMSDSNVVVEIKENDIAYTFRYRYDDISYISDYQKHF